MSTSINYCSTLLCGAAMLTTGDTSRTAPTTVSTLLTPANGAMIERLTVMPVATTVTSVVRFFKYDGTTYHLVAEVQIAAQTLANGTAVIPTTMEAVDNPNLFPMIIPAGWSLRATVNDTQTGIKVYAEGGGA